MAGRIGLRVTGSRVAVLLVTLAFSGLALPPSAQALGDTCNGRLATSTGLDASDQKGPVVLTGTPGDDVIIGSDHADSIDGLGGHDVICAGKGGDTVNGGGGADRIFGEKGDDSISGGAGTDNLYGGDGDDTLNGDGDNTEDELDGGEDDDTCTGDDNDETSDCEE